jgi:putative membrane protein
VFEKGDEVMADDADIPLDETSVPVELDRIYASLQDLTRTLGPNGVNKDGTLNRVLTSGANALEGQGAKANRMIRELSEAARTFGDGSSDLFATVTRIAQFTEVLSENDETVRRFIQQLTGVSRQLAGERDEIQDLLAAVAGAVGTVETFVRDNREKLGSDVRKLSRVLENIDSERSNLDTALEVAPVVIALPILWATYHRSPLTTLVYVCIFAHSVVLMIGGEYTYARVPFGFQLQDVLGLHRNPYDKIGHFFQGFVPALIAREILLRGEFVRGRRMLVFIVVCVVMAISATYELIEWWVALAAGQGAADFLGTQGDPWDTQSDMFMALIGSISALLLLS